MVTFITGRGHTLGYYLENKVSPQVKFM